MAPATGRALVMPPDAAPQSQPIVVEGSSRQELDRSLASGLAWTGFAKFGAQILSWASTLLVARLLTPTDYGITGMAGVFFVLVQQISEFGLGLAVVRQRSLEPFQIARLGGLAVLIGVGLSLILLALAPAIATFYGEPAVQSVLLVTAGLFTVTAFQVIPSALLARDLAFRRLALIETTESLTQAVLTLLLAAAGAGYWALVLGAMVAKSTSTVLLVLARPHPLQWPRELRALRESLSFGWRVVISRLTAYVYQNSDFLIIGRVLGTVALGAYSLSWNLASTPGEKVTSVIGRVVMPVLSVVQHDRAALARYFILGAEGLTLLVLPATVGLALVAPDFVPVVLGSQWVAAVLPLQVLSLHVLIRCFDFLAGQVILAIGEARRTARAGIVLALTMPIAVFLAATQWGINGVAFVWLVVYPLATVPLIIGYAMRQTDLSAERLFRALWPALSSTGAMALVVLLLSIFLRGWTAPPRLAAEIAGGALTYGAVLGIAHRNRIQGLITAARGLKRQARHAQ